MQEESRCSEESMDGCKPDCKCLSEPSLISKLRAEFVQCHKDLRTTRTDLHIAIEGEIKARRELKTREQAFLLSGAIIGKNAESRDAQLREATKEEFWNVEIASETVRLAQLKFDLAKYNIDMIKWSWQLLMTRSD